MCDVRCDVQGASFDAVQAALGTRTRHIERRTTHPVLPAGLVLAVAPELDFVARSLAVIAAVLSMGPVRFDHAGAGRVCTLVRCRHNPPPSWTLRPSKSRLKLDGP